MDKPLFYCKHCDRYLPSSSFNPNRTQSRGVSYYCKECHKKRMKSEDYRVVKNNNRRKKYPNKQKEHIEKYGISMGAKYRKEHADDLNYILRLTLKRAKGRAKKNGLKLDINKDFLHNIYRLQNGLCSLTNRTLKLGFNDPNTLSIDRIDSNGGYTKDNVQLVCCLANMIKRNHNQEELIQFCQDVINSHQLKRGVGT